MKRGRSWFKCAYGTCEAHIGGERASVSPTNNGWLADVWLRQPLRREVKDGFGSRQAAQEWCVDILESDGA